VKVWDARPWTPAAAVERETLAQLEFLFAKPLRKADVLDCLQNPRTILRPQARQLALALVDRYPQEADAEKYHQASRAVVRQPYLNDFQYDFALRQAQTACSLAPDKGEYQTTLGMAQYRAGAWQESVAILAKADQAHPRQAPVLAFLAMAHHQLGHKDEAKAALIRLHEVIKDPGFDRVGDQHSFWREAEVLIEGKAPDPKK
jgi:tetratricopeptide (TPR) repeat protein